MLGKRPASSTVESSTVTQPSKRLKPNPNQQQDTEQSTTATSWLPSVVWNGIKTLLGSPARTVAAAPSRDQSRSRQRPRQRQNPLPTFDDVNDNWIWQTMTAKQRGQPLPREPAVLRELRERKEREEGKSKAVTNGNSTFLAGQTSSSQNGRVYGSEVDGGYRRKKPMGSRKNTSDPTTQSTRKPSRRKRIPTPDFLKPSSSNHSSLESMSISSASSSSDETQHAAQQSLYDFITHSLPISSDTTSSPDSSSSTDSSDSSDSSDSDSSSTTSSHSATSHTQSPISISSSSLPSQPFQLASSLPLPSPASSFFSSPWLPKSRMILKRKQHRLALQSRDLSTLESLRSMPSTPTTVSNNSGSSGGGIRDDEGDTEFRVYKAGVRNLVRQEDEGEQAPRLTRPSKPARTTSSLLGPASLTYASVLSAASKPSSSSSSNPRPRTRVDRTLENYHKTQTESPAKKALSSSELFSQFERLRVAQEEAEKASLLLDEPAQPVSLPPRRRKWPKKVPREIQDRVSEMLRASNYEKTIKGASVDTKAIRRLKPGTWLDDSVVAFYGTLLTNRSEEAQEKGEFGEREMRLKKIWCFNSFFWTMYNESGYKRVKKWTKKFDVFEKDMIIFPININNSHWTCAAVNIRDKRFEYYDSLGGKMKKAYSQLRKWLQEEHEAKKGGPIDLSDWEDYWDDNVPQQNNSNDCGVFTCAFMESLSREVEGFDFDQRQMPYLRQKIAYEIDQAELKPEEKWVDVEEE